jgi:flavorubredoxin
MNYSIIYDIMWDGTRRMAEAIARGITETDNTVAQIVQYCPL